MCAYLLVSSSYTHFACFYNSTGTSWFISDNIWPCLANSINNVSSSILRSYSLRTSYTIWHYSSSALAALCISCTLWCVAGQYDARQPRMRATCVEWEPYNWLAWSSALCSTFSARESRSLHISRPHSRATRTDSCVHAGCSLFYYNGNYLF